MEEEKQKKDVGRVVRILSTDIEGNSKTYVGLTKVKGISWAISNAICKKTGINKNKKIGELTEKEIEKISDFSKKMNITLFLKNRRKDFDDGEDKHLIGSDLDLKKDFDIKRLRKIKSYRGIRHATGQPTRGQRTRSHFRKNKSRGTGIKKKKKTIMENKQ